ncbi:hypothetical protein lerEdw1_019144 [Lerista edwardsae]|nr:hypothetical protein lerEdw1_019144 [Lerista edwardsae]
MDKAQRLGVRVFLNRDSATLAPHCPHGPTLLFSKMLDEKEEGRRFYACSACRERKDCNFFQWENEKVSEARLLAREKYNQSHQPPFSHTENVARYKEFVLLPLSKRKFCQECQQLLLPGEWGRHAGHQLLSDISPAQLKRPSRLLCPLENKKTNAQYLFADRSCQFLLDLVVALGFKRVLCVGTPRFHELIKFQASQGQKNCIKSLLLDIDFRYSQFYTEGDFCHYNMFNHYFFGGEAAYEVCQKFLQQNRGQDVIMVTDPPFGGLVEALAFSFKKLIAMWRQTGDADPSSKELPILWIFPYFFESRILEFFPDFTMLDYQVDYDNHALYKHGKMGRKQSPVRIFTNLSPHLVMLPVEEGYRFCSLCQRYVSLNNQHCEICNSCTSKLGFTAVFVVTVRCQVTLVQILTLAVLFAVQQIINASLVLNYMWLGERANKEFLSHQEKYLSITYDYMVLMINSQAPCYDQDRQIHTNTLIEITAATMPAFRQVGEKQLPQEVIFMAWSPKRDLIALANKVGEVLLHRLANFQRVWSLPPSESTGKEVTALAWRPDGKILAFGLADTKRVILCDVEKPESLHSFSVDAPITYMHWMEVTEENGVLASFYNAEDESNLLLPKLPALPKNYSTTAKIFSEEKSDEIMKLMGDVRLNALVLGGSAGFLEIYAYGMYKIATVAGLDTSLLSTYLPEVTRMARKFTHISTLLQGLRKLGQSMESSYSSIQKLVISHLQRVIDSSMKNFKAFFRWLYVAMLRMSDDHVPPELNKMTQKDITFVADFLTEHFNEAPELYNRKGKYFNVERVGQYLKDEDDDLVSPPNTEGNHWFNFLQNSNHLKESPLLFPFYPQKSLHFVKRRMEGIIDQCLQKPADVIGKSVRRAFCMPLYKESQRSANNGLLAIDFGNSLNNESLATSFYSCLDAHFYDDETITVVLAENMEQEGKERILAQLPLSSIYMEENQKSEFSWNSGQRLDEQCNTIPTRTVAIEGQWRVLENMKAQYVAVNGIRKVSCVLSSNLRHVRVFEMDVEDDGEAEEEEEEETAQHANADQEELGQSADDPEDCICIGSANLADEIEEHESNLNTGDNL